MPLPLPASASAAPHVRARPAPASSSSARAAGVPHRDRLARVPSASFTAISALSASRFCRCSAAICSRAAFASRFAQYASSDRTRRRLVERARYPASGHASDAVAGHGRRGVAGLPWRAVATSASRRRASWDVAACHRRSTVRARMRSASRSLDSAGPRAEPNAARSSALVANFIGAARLRMGAAHTQRWSIARNDWCRAGRRRRASADAPVGRDDVENPSASTARPPPPLDRSGRDRSTSASRVASLSPPSTCTTRGSTGTISSSFYTDGGLAPREAGVSSYTWTGILIGRGRCRTERAAARRLFGLRQLFFVAHIAALLALLLGWRTRLAARVVWVCLASLNQRNAYVTHTFDQYTAGLLLFCVLGDLPLGARFSLPRGARPRRRQPPARWPRSAPSRWCRWRCSTSAPSRTRSGRAGCRRPRRRHGVDGAAGVLAARAGAPRVVPRVRLGVARRDRARGGGRLAIAARADSGAQAAAFVAHRCCTAASGRRSRSTSRAADQPRRQSAAPRRAGGVGVRRRPPPPRRPRQAGRHRRRRRRGRRRRVAVGIVRRRIAVRRECGARRGGGCGRSRRARASAVAALALVLRVHGRLPRPARARRSRSCLPVRHLQVALGISSQYFAVFSRVSAT